MTRSQLARLACALTLFAACDNAETPESRLKSGPDTPTEIRLSWNDDPSTTAAVIWRTENEVQAAGVEYGTSSAYGNFVAAENFEINGISGFFHEAKLTGLAPASLVHYRVGSKSGVSEDRTLQTGPAPSEDMPFSFILMGDSRAESDMLGIGARYPEVLARIAAENPLPSFILDSGDYTSFGQSEEWVDWLAAVHASGLAIPRLTTFGNHEIIEKNYYGLMSLPPENEEKFYALDYGPLLIICLNTGFGGLPAGQQAFLQETLSKSTAKWKLAFFHMPPYNAGNHSDSETRYDVREQWVPLFEKYGVDLVVGGHDHNYQRFGYLKGGKKVAAGEGPFYLISGGAGAPLYGPDEASEDHPLLDPDGFQKLEHYVMATLDGNTLTLQAKRLDGTVFDTVTLTK